MRNDSHRDSYLSRAFRAARDEWNRRTWYGKLWYPVWVAWKALLFASMAVVVFIALALVGDPIGYCLKAIHRTFRSSAGRLIRRIRATLPEVYHD